MSAWFPQKRRGAAWQKRRLLVVAICAIFRKPRVSFHPSLWKFWFHFPGKNPNLADFEASWMEEGWGVSCVWTHAFSLHSFALWYANNEYWMDAYTACDAFRRKHLHQCNCLVSLPKTTCIAVLVQVQFFIRQWERINTIRQTLLTDFFFFLKKARYSICMLASDFYKIHNPNTLWQPHSILLSYRGHISSTIPVDLGVSCGLTLQTFLWRASGQEFLGKNFFKITENIWVGGGGIFHLAHHRQECKQGWCTTAVPLCIHSFRNSWAAQYLC